MRATNQHRCVTLKPPCRIFMLSAKQRRIALKKNIEHARDMARRLRADGADEITLTYYADEESFRAMKLPEAGLFGSNPGRLVKAVFEAKGSSAGVRG